MRSCYKTFIGDDAANVTQFVPRIKSNFFEITFAADYILSSCIRLTPFTIPRIKSRGNTYIMRSPKCAGFLLCAYTLLRLSSLRVSFMKNKHDPLYKNCKALSRWVKRLSDVQCILPGQSEYLIQYLCQIYICVVEGSRRSTVQRDGK